MSTENLKELRNALSCWQDDYDRDDDKEQYDMFGAAIDAVSRLEKAERERGELRAEIERRDATAVVSFYRDGVVAAANYIDQQREAFDNEHGQCDPDTGSFEFGNIAAQEHSDTLAELAEGVRSLHQNATADALAMGAQPAVLPPEKPVHTDLSRTDIMKNIAYNQALNDVKELGAPPQKPVVLPADRADDKSVSTFDNEKFYDAGWNSRGKADKEALDASNVPYEVKK